MHWIIFLKRRYSLIHSRKLILSHKTTGELNEYKKHLDYCFAEIEIHSCLNTTWHLYNAKCVQLYYFWKEERWVLSTTFYDGGNGESWNLSDLPQTVTIVTFFWHRMGVGGGHTAALNDLSWMAGCSGCPCLHDCFPGRWGCCSFRSHGLWTLCLWEASAGHSGEKIWGSMGTGQAHAELIHLPVGFLQRTRGLRERRFLHGPVL